jgi:hypothetical protein
MHIGYWWESQRETDHWQGIDVGVRIILKLALEKQDGIGLSQDRDTVKTLRIA